MESADGLPSPAFCTNELKQREEMHGATRLKRCKEEETPPTRWPNARIVPTIVARISFANCPAQYAGRSSESHHSGATTDILRISAHTIAHPTSETALFEAGRLVGQRGPLYRYAGSRGQFIALF